MIALDVEIVRQGVNCLDDVIATVCSWHHRRFELMYARCLNFQFDSENTAKDMGERISAEYSDDYLHLLEKYHGLHCEMHLNQPISQGIRMITEQLRAGNPLLILLDCFWIPWVDKYQKVHDFGHTLVGVGFDTETNELFVTDPFFEKKSVRISYEQLEHGYYGCVTVTPSSDQLAPYDVILNELSMTVQELLQTGKTSQAITAFARETGTIPFQPDATAEAMVSTSPLFMNLGKVTNARNNYGKLLRYLHEYHGDERFEKMEEELKALSIQWSSVRGFLTKMALVDEASMHTYLKENTEKKLIDISNKEQAIMERLLALYKLQPDQAGLLEAEGYSAAALEQEEGAITVNHYVDLTRYFTNKGFGSTENSADFDSNGFYFSSTSSQPESPLHLDDMSFDVSFAGGNSEYDNIACYGQEVDMEGKKGHFLTILGCSEMGSFLDELIVKYEDGSKDTLSFGFSDWWSFFAVNKERVAWSGQAAHKEQGLLNHEVHIYASKLKLKSDRPVQSIVLPLLPNIHIFAISVGTS
ncbi:BtrH N-terminal domain-containing protein [Paenibacillus sp. SN-8-1]|uniref:BtrH N-terminal domain-containing protein n=1 Tax=Paenibacillus sp. SN-8-1 TaxID=3435409 RepID=UPI003D9A7207